MTDLENKIKNVKMELIEIDADNMNVIAEKWETIYKRDDLSEEQKENEFYNTLLEIRGSYDS